MGSDFTLHYFWWPFFVIFFGLLILFLKDRFFPKKRKLHKIQKNVINQRQASVSNDSGIIFISKIVKPYNIKDEQHFAIPVEQDKVLNQIKYNGLFDVKVVISKDTSEPSITVKGDKAFVQLVEIVIRGDTIEIKHPQISCNYELDCQIIIKTTSLTSFNSRGRGCIEIEGIYGDKFHFSNNSVEDSYLSGKVKDLFITSRSKASLFAQSLIAENGGVDNHGIGDVYCNFTERLYARVNNSGNIYVKDITVKKEVDIDGSGKVLYRPFEDPLLNFICLAFQIALPIKT